MTQTGRTLVAGVIGWPVAHSRSPALHGHWFERYGVDGVYVPFPVPPGRGEAAVRAVAALGIRGCNVTVPHKEVAARAVDRLDSTARRMGAVNLVIVGEDGSLEGRNTDGFGFIENLKATIPAWRPEAGPAVVLGAGGARAEVFGGVEFPQGAISFADVVVSYLPGLEGADPTAPHQGAGNALGAPNYNGVNSCASQAACSFVSLGVGGALVVGVLASFASGQGVREGFNRAGCFSSILGAMLLILIGRQLGWGF